MNNVFLNITYMLLRIYNNHSVRIDLEELDSTSNVRKIYVTRLFCMLPNVLKHAILYFQSKTFNYKDTDR